MSSTFQVVTNGLISFGEPLLLHIPYSFPTAFPEVYDSYTLAPFWSDVDISILGEIKYEVHSADSNIPGSTYLLNEVNYFISNKTGEDFVGTWMLVAFWDSVHPYAGFFPGPEVSNFFVTFAL